MIEVDSVSYSYDMSKPPALAGVTFSVEPSELVAVVGANGSSKSTLAKLLNGILVPNTGAVKVLGIDTRDLSFQYKIKQAVALLFPNPDSQLVSTVTNTYQENTPFQHRALHNISCAIPEGQITGITGPIGSGKSTFLQLLNGILKPISGRVRVDGIPPDALF